MTTFLQEFQELFQRQDGKPYFAPGRINLIGEHTDYNGGYVFPCAISLGTYGVAGKREDRLVRVYSKNFKADGIRQFSLDDLAHKKEDGWLNYPKGVFHELDPSGALFPHGLDILLYGNLPNGSGLSSSSSLELLIGSMLKDCYRLKESPIDLVKLGKQVENHYIGVNSGIMDQFAIGMGRKDKAILLNCANLDYSYVPVELGDYRIVIMNTNKKRALVESKYNERFAETREALKRIQTIKVIDQLGDLSLAEFEDLKAVLEDPILEKRARHAVSENERTKEACRLLESGDLAGFGKLMNASHLSTEKDYEVTGLELDTLVHTAWQQEGVLGARMTGAGFGGCAIALVHKDAIAAFEKAVGQTYQEVVGYEPSFYIASISDGAFANY